MKELVPRLVALPPTGSETVDKFQDEQGPKITIMSPGGVGLNLTRADHVFIMDPCGILAAEDQAADRAHRIGQKYRYGSSNNCK